MTLRSAARSLYEAIQSMLGSHSPDHVQQALEQELRRLIPNWSQEKPTCSGVYWHKPPGIAEPRLVVVDHGRIDTKLMADLGLTRSRAGLKSAPGKSGRGNSLHEPIRPGSLLGAVVWESVRREDGIGRMTRPQKDLARHLSGCNESGNGVRGGESKAPGCFGGYDKTPEESGARPFPPVQREHRHGLDPGDSSLRRGDLLPEQIPDP